jgi:hypothetical protein
MPTLTTQRILQNSLGTYKELVKNAGGVAYFDARKATGDGLPTNSPLTSPWIDLSPHGNNATPTNMAGTTASGVDVTDVTKPFWVLDNTDDHFQLADSTSLDMKNAPLACFQTIYPSTLITGWMLSKALSSGATTQYGTNLDSGTSTFRAFLENSQRGQSATLTPDNWYNIGWIWDGTTIRYYVNGVYGGTDGTYSGALTTRANVRIGCRSNSADGSSNAIFYRGRIATVTVYTGTKCNESNILKAEKALSKVYIN